MTKKLTVLAATGLATMAIGAAAPAPAHAVCDPDPVLGMVCWSDCQWAWLDAKRPVESVQEALRPRVCPD